MSGVQVRALGGAQFDAPREVNLDPNRADRLLRGVLDGADEGAGRRIERQSQTQTPPGRVPGGVAGNVLAGFLTLATLGSIVSLAVRVVSASVSVFAALTVFAALATTLLCGGRLRVTGRRFGTVAGGAGRVTRKRHGQDRHQPNQTGLSHTAFHV